MPEYLYRKSISYGISAGICTKSTDSPRATPKKNGVMLDA